jgi:hypothetical protein
MKNQYFGDKRDYFKYGVLEQLMRRTSRLRQLTCLWMLTPDYPNNKDGNKPLRALPGGERLASFLAECRDKGVRDVRVLDEYFKSIGFRYVPHGDDATQPFARSSRRAYFDAVPNSGLRAALVFFDPDNGLAPVGGATAAHVTLDELRSVFRRMDSDSVAVVYQHLARVPSAVFWPRVAGRIATSLDSPVAVIAEADVALMVVPKDSGLLAHLMETLKVHQSIARQEGQRVSVLRVDPCSQEATLSE